MSLAFHSTKESLYLQVYDHYKNLIMEHRIPAGSRMPSLRKCATELKLSRTTIENAYLQLAADGYIVARAQSGYYVTSIADQKPVSTASWHADLPPVQYDFASNGVGKAFASICGSVISRVRCARVTVFSLTANRRVRRISVRCSLTISDSGGMSTALPMIS